MKCEYCDSLIKNVPENGICPNCGGALGIEDRHSTELRFPDPPVGIYVDPAGDYIEISDTYIKTFKDIPLGKDVVTEIPFDTIYSVKFEPGAYFKMGFLCVRRLDDIEIPMPVKHSQAIKDNTTIVLSSTNNEKFYPVYLFLKKCADIVNGEETE